MSRQKIQTQMFYLPHRTFWGQQPPPDFDISKDYYKELGVGEKATKEVLITLISIPQYHAITYI